MKTFFMPFGLAAGKIVVMIPEYEQLKYRGIKEYPVYHPDHFYLTHTKWEFPRGEAAAYHIAFLDINVEQPLNFYGTKPKNRELFRILHPSWTQDFDEVEIFSGEFRDRNEIYYVPLNKLFFQYADWQTWLVELTNWANIIQKSVVVHASEEVSMLSDFKVLYRIPNIFIYQSHTDWGILPGILSSGEKFAGL
jgi:hypothetical protein